MALDGSCLNFLGMWRVGLGNNAWELGVRLCSKGGSYGTSTGTVEVSIMRYPSELEHEAAVFHGRAISLDAEFSVDVARGVKVQLRATEAMLAAGGMMKDLAALSTLRLELAEDGARIRTEWPLSSWPLQREPGSFGLHHPSEHRVSLLLDPKRTGALPHNTKQASYRTLQGALPELKPSLASFGGPFACYTEMKGSRPLCILPRSAEEMRSGAWGDLMKWSSRWDSNPEGDDDAMAPPQDIEGFHQLARTMAVGYVVEGLRQLLRDDGVPEEQVDDIMGAATEVPLPWALED